MFETESSELGRLVIQGKAAIIDGQHRLGGFVFLYESEECCTRHFFYPSSQAFR